MRHSLLLCFLLSVSASAAEKWEEGPIQTIQAVDVHKCQSDTVNIKVNGKWFYTPETSNSIQSIALAAYMGDKPVAIKYDTIDEHCGGIFKVHNIRLGEKT
ncbi:hypothetical protein [Vibrio nigripulchritudo]|uniref:hypothetical protein n=1 Tax=Vibrio nigripulchritudo TaxID=28173 RepID=UPI0005FA1906|nr:hypothetical protein [Vibrio nigripulchritudo]KJY73826.1 hypothetical protein TW74_21195 [Vibrio nigripulchritudo]